MFKSILVFFFFVFPILAKAELLAHDPAGCPDLSGIFVLKENGVAQAKFELISSQNDSGVNELTMIKDGVSSTDLLNGIAIQLNEKVSETILCNGQAVILYRIDDGRLVKTVKFSLDANSNLLISYQTLITTDSAIGYRQAH